MQGFGAALAEVLRRHNAALQALPASAAAARGAAAKSGDLTLLEVSIRMSYIIAMLLASLPVCRPLSDMS